MSVSQPVTPQSVASARSKNSDFDAAKVLRALRRRWVPCVLIGVPLAVLCGVAAFFALPAPYIATAEIYIKSYDDNLIFDTKEPQAEFRVRKETHQRRVTSRPVLTAALRGVEASQYGTLKNVADPVSWLAENISVRRAGQEFFTISLAGERPKEIADLVSKVAHAYMSEVVEAEINDRYDRMAELQTVLNGVEEELQIQRNVLSDLVKSSSSASSLQSSQKHEFNLNMQIEVRKQITQVEMELLRLRVRESVLGDETKVEPADVDIPDAALENLLAQERSYIAAKNNVDQMKRFLATTQSRVVSGHPSIAAAQAKLDAAESDLLATAEALKPVVLKKIEEQQKGSEQLRQDQLPDEIAQLEKARAALGKELEDWKVNEKESGLYSLQIDDATKELARLEALSDTLTREIRNREFELKNQKSRLPAQIMEDALVPTARNFKKKIAGTAGAAGGMLALVVGAFLFVDVRAGRINSSKELSDSLSLPLIASIPALPTSAMSNRAGSRRNRQKTMFWTSALKESVDAARTMLLSLAEREGLKSILISSAMPAEGKTTLSLHLATSLARAGRRVLLVDADLRRPSLSQVYGIAGAGVCEVVRGETTLEEAVVDGNVDGLSILPAGQFDEESLELIALNGFGDTMAQMREQWDFVIVDSSPVLPVCDGLLFAASVDSVIFAIRRDVSRRSLVAVALDRFRAIGKPVIGAVAIGLHDDPTGYSEMQKYQSRYYNRALVQV